TVTLVGVEGRRMMRLVRELPSEQFGALLNEYQRVVPHALEEMGARQVDVAGDSLAGGGGGGGGRGAAAVAAQGGGFEHGWPYGLRPEVSIGLHSGEAGIGSLGAAAVRCAELCDAAEGGQIFLSPATAGLLEDEDLGYLALRDLGEVRTRRAGDLVHAYELLAENGSGPDASTI